MIKNDEFDRELLGKIKKEHIIPKPKWHFLLKNYIILAMGSVSLLIGGAAFSIIIFFARNNDWKIFKEAGGGLLNFILISLPYFWLVFLIFFIFIVYYNFKNTKHGYRYPVYVILAINISLSIFLGIIFYYMGAGQFFDYATGRRVPLYEKIMNRQVEFWSDPEEGRLSGVIIDKINDDDFHLVDFSEKKWEIINNGGSATEFPERMEPGQPVRIMGKKLSEDSFKAVKILPPPLPGRGFFERHKEGNFTHPPMLNSPRSNRNCLLLK